MKYDVIYNNKKLTTNSLDEDSIYDLCNKRVLLISYAKFYNPPSLTFSFLKPKKFLKEIIDATAKNFDKHTIGVHVRRNDNIKSIQYSTNELFFKEIESKIQEQSELNFFLATDCPVTESLFVKRYGKRVHTINKENSRSTTKGIQSAVIDLYLLSRTTEIFGSYWSSFSSTAAEISNTPLSIIGRD